VDKGLKQTINLYAKKEVVNGIKQPGTQVQEGVQRSSLVMQRLGSKAHRYDIIPVATTEQKVPS
jgi:hypothetical protein